MISSATIGGYALEEVIARMLADNGYRLIQSAAPDPDRLVDGKHGLLVRGRGAEHQADGLGDLLLPVPFSDPVRLFVEAKNRVSRTGIDAVRNGYGVVCDVNQFQPASARGPHWNRRGFHYRYSLFSTSGFTPLAQTFAVAHQISLIDLSGSSFSSLRRAVERFSVSVRALCMREGLASFPVGQMRAAIRLALGTAGHAMPEDRAEAGQLLEALDPSAPELARMSSGALLELASSLAQAAVGDMVLGFPAGPFVVVLRPDDPVRFAEWVARSPDRAPAQVRSTTTGPGGDWVLLLNGLADESPVVLRFSTPDEVTDWLLSPVGRTEARLSDLQSGPMSSLVVYQAGRPITLELDLDFDEGEPLETETVDVRMVRRRHQRIDRRFLVPDASDDFFDGDGSRLPVAWSEEAAWQFFEGLLREDPARASVLAAALDNDESWVSREIVYRLMGYAPDRLLRRFTMPYNRHRNALVAQGLLAAGLPDPMTAEYPNPGGWTAGFRLDQGLARALRSARGGDSRDEAD